MNNAQADIAEAARQQGILNENAASVASLNKHKDLPQRSRFAGYWFQFLLQQYKADESFSMNFVRVYLFLHFLIIGISITDWNGIETKYLSVSTTSTIQIIIKSCIAGVILLSYLTLMCGLLFKSEVSSMPSSLVYLCCILKYLNWYIVAPCSFMLYSGQLFGQQADATRGDIVTTWLIMILSFGICIATIYMRSELPSSGKFNCPNRFTEVIIYSTTLLLVLITKNVPAATNSSVFDYVSILINFLCVVLSWHAQVFWWMSINVFYTLGHLFISTGRISVKVVGIAIPDATLFQYVIFVGLFEIIALRVGYNMCLYRLKMRIRECHNATHQDNFILFFTYDISKQAEESNLAGQLPQDLQFEMSQIGRLSLYSKRRRQMLVNADVNSHTKNMASRALGITNVTRLLANFNLEAKDPLWAFFVKFTELIPSNQEEMFMYLLLQLVFLGKNLMGISTSLAQYRRGFGKDANNSFQLYLIESMFQGRLEHLSVEDNTEHFSRTTLGEVFSEISKDLGIIQEHQAAITAMNLFNTLQNQTKQSGAKDESSSIKLDLSRILVGKHEFLLIISQINKLINIKIDVYSNLFEKAIQKSHYLYNKNQVAYRHAKELDKSFTALLSTELVGNYVLACGVCYFLKVRYDIRRAEKIFKMYQNRLSRFQAMTLIPLKEITEANFQYNSVIMRLNVSHQSTLGMITDISPNYKEHIGEPANNEPTRINVNTLFPGKMCEDHILMMRRTEDQPIFNVQQDFQLNGFDGYLKPVRYILKLDPAITSGLHSIALLRFKLNNEKCLLLANEQLDLMSAEIDFWRMMRSFKVQSPIEDIYTLSESLSVHMTWIKFLRTVEITTTDETGAEVVIGSVATNSDQLLANLNSASNISSENAKLAAKDVAYNQLKLRVLECFSSFDATGIFHRMSDELDLPEETKGLPLLASIENIKFGKEVYYRVWITFNNNHMRDRTSFFDPDAEEEEADHGLISRKEGRLSESESKADQKIEYTVSEHNKNKLKSNIAMTQDNEFYSHAATYEKILQKAKDHSPIMALLSEATNRKYPEEVQECIRWLQDFYNFVGDDANIDKALTYKGLVTRRSKSGSKNTRSIDHLNTKSMSDMNPSQVNNPSPSNAQDPRKFASNLPSSFSKRGNDGNTLKPAAANTTEDLSYTEDFNNPAKRSAIGKSSSQVGSDANYAVSPRNPQPESTTRRLKETDRSHRTTSGMSNQLIAGSSQVDRYTQASSNNNNGRSRSNPKNKVTKLESKQTAAPNIKMKGSMKKETESKFFNFSGKISSKKTSKHTESKSLAKKQSQALTGNDPKSKKKKLYAKYATEKQKNEGQPPAGDASYEDIKSQRTSVFSQLAKSLFKMRNGRANKNSTTSNFDNKEDLNVDEITKMAGENAMISHNPANINLITKYITDYKLVRRNETNPDGEKNASVSSKSTTSRGSHFLKMVNTIMDTKKGGNAIYTFTLVSVVFSIYFAIVLQYVFSSLRSYNNSNLNNFILLSNFIFLDRKLIESCETQDFLYEHTAASWNKTEYQLIRDKFQDSLPPTINSTTYLFTRINECVEDISNALRSVTDETVNLIDKKDAQDVVTSTYRKQELDYADRFNSDVNFYKPWKMPYFSTIIYYMDIFRQNKDLLIEVNKLGWDSDFNFELDASMSERWVKTIRSKINLDSTVFNKVLQVMQPNFATMVDSVIVSAVDRHFKEVYILLYLSIGVTICLAAYIIWAAVKINIIQKDYLMNYNMLRPWELFVMVEELDKIRIMFTTFAYNEIEMLNQYLDFNLFSSLAAFANRVTRLQEHFSRDKDKAARIKKFSHDFFFFSSKFLLIFIFLTGCLFGIMGISIYVFLNINNNRIGVEMLLFDSHIKILGVMKSYLTLTLLAIYGHNLQISGTQVAANAFSGAFSEFLVFQTGKRNDFIKYFGQQGAKRIDDISFSDICSEMLSIPSLREKLAPYTDICRKINDGSATKGIIGFLQYQKYFLDSEILFITQNYQDFITSSETETPIRALTLEVFSSKFNEMRLGNWICFNVYYYVMSEMATNLVTSIKMDLEYYVSEVMQYISVGIYGILLLVYGFALRQQGFEIRICYETFKLIDPFFLMNNRYLQFRFKAAYKGVA